MATLEELASNEQIKEEYRKTFLLNVFQKICAKMNHEPQYRQHIQTLFRQSYNPSDTVRAIVRSEMNYELTEDDTSVMYKWFAANLKKTSHRKAIPLSLKEELYIKQNGKCMVCGEALGNNWSRIHVDHIVPWKLVGDELEDNYQDLCETCNECKSARTDYIFRSLLNLV